MPAAASTSAVPTTSSGRVQATDLAGQTINIPGRFRLRLVRVLGLGSYGTVYVAEELRTRIPSASKLLPGTSPVPRGSVGPSKKQYAVKVLAKQGLDARQRMFQQREIELHKLASGHPGVLTLHAVHETLDHCFVVLDYLPDGDLFSMIVSEGRYLEADPFPGSGITRDRLITSVFLQILEAIEHCHRLGISHRDLKPENLLCREGGREVVLADFGLATRERLTSEFGCGSSFYMSPECQGTFFRELGAYSAPQNDVWSCGVILVNLTCGRNPWRTATMSDETFRAFMRDPNFLSAILPISVECEDILKRVFSINPMRRPTISELRRMVKGVRRWNMSSEDLERAPRTAREAARAAFGEPATKPAPVQADASPAAGSPSSPATQSSPEAESERSFPETAQDEETESECSTRYAESEEWDLGATSEDEEEVLSITLPKSPIAPSFPATATTAAGTTSTPARNGRKAPPAPIFCPPAAGFVRPKPERQDFSFCSVVSESASSTAGEPSPLLSPTTPTPPQTRLVAPPPPAWTRPSRPDHTRRPTQQRVYRARTPTNCWSTDSSGSPDSSSSSASSTASSSQPSTPVSLRFARAEGRVVVRAAADEDDGYESPASAPPSPVKAVLKGGPPRVEDANKILKWTPAS